MLIFSSNQRRDIINAVLMRRSKNTFPCVTNIEDICQCYEKPQEIYAT